MKYGEQEIKEARLEQWPNPCPERDYEINITFPEFTCLCPRSGYPDFAKIEITYVPNEWIVELKSLKLFLNRYRNQYISHEQAACEIFDALEQLLRPKKLKVIADFHPRGNVHTVIRVEK